MEKIHTLTVNGKTYILEDPSAARIDDSVVGSDAWSGRQIIDKLCPAFSEKGAEVTCKPLQGYPLGVISHIQAVQEGSGDPRPQMWKAASHMITYPIDDRAYAAQLTIGETYRVTAHSETALTGITVEIVENGESISGTFEGNTFQFTMPLHAPSSDGNSSEVYITACAEEEVFSASFTLQQLIPGNVRPITGFDAVQLTHGNIEGSSALTAVLGQTVGEGTYDWNTGVLTVTHALIRLTSDMRWAMTGASNPNGIRSFYVNENTENARDSQNYPVRSSHYINNYNWAVSSVTYENAIKILNSRIYLTDARFTDLASFKAFLEEETVQLMYALKEPVTYQLAPAQILALSGQNTLTSNTGDTEVCGRLDMIPLLQSLMEKI